MCRDWPLDAVDVRAVVELSFSGGGAFNAMFMQRGRSFLSGMSERVLKTIEHVADVNPHRDIRDDA